jgi:hypothetical protein
MTKKLLNSSKKKYTKIINGEEIVFQSFATYLINLFIADKKSINYPREMKIANTLGKISTDQKFWDSLPEQKVNSLTFFIKKENQDIIRYHHDLFIKNEWAEFVKIKKKTLDFPKQDVILSETKVGEDLEIKKPILSLKDFINYG